MTREMKPSYRHVTWNANYSFNVKADIGEDLSNSWHYHPEIELNLIQWSAGTRIIGSSVESFSHNDVVLIGKNIPHAFLHDEKYIQGQYGPPPKAVVIQFYEHFLGKEFLGLPELKEIQQVLKLAQKGLSITDQGKKEIIPLMENIQGANSIDRLLLLLQIMKTLISKDTYRVIQHEEVLQSIKNDDERINAILEYTRTHFDQQIKIEDVARLVSLTKESFCRYFKSQTQKTYVHFLTEYRINMACKMIVGNACSMKEVGYSCGFDSLSNFYSQFKKIMKQSPLEYKGIKCQEQKV
jgi:AraC-like DNA-binding protein